MIYRKVLPLASVFVLLRADSSVSGETGNRRAELEYTRRSTPVNATFEAQLEKLLESSGDLSLIEIRQKVDDLVAGTDYETRLRHEAWKRAQHARDNQRRERIKDAILRLSKPAQAKLIRIILVQEDEELPQNYKRERLADINRSLPPEIREELSAKLRDSDIFTEFGFY